MSTDDLSSPARDARNGFVDSAAFWSACVETQWVYAKAQFNEYMGLSAPRQEPSHDFAIERNRRAGRIPETKAPTPVILKNFPFCRVWHFDRVEQRRDDPTFLVVSPHSGRDVRIMSDWVLALLPIGNVRLVENRERHHVPAPHTNGLDDSTGALIEVAKQNPNCHLIGLSQSGVPATVATAWMYQNRELIDQAPASLTINGSPINAQLTPTPLDKAAASSSFDPPCVMVGPHWPGAGHLVVPGGLSKIYLQHNPAKKIPTEAESQSMPLEHIRDTLQRVFREYWLANGTYRFNNQKIDPGAITCPVISVAGGLDDIVPPAQVHDIKRLTPNASSHVQKTLPGMDHYDLVDYDVVAREIVPLIKQGLAKNGARAPRFANG